MDPQAALKELVEAVHAQDIAQYTEAAKNLRSWLNGGGFPPEIVGHTELDRVLAYKLCQLHPWITVRALSSETTEDNGGQQCRNMT